jgi:4-hydroxy-tetrahydrodipicolinate synthase
LQLLLHFTDSYGIDYKRLHELCNWLIDEGVNGLVPAGSLGEYATLNVEERAKIVETVVKAANGRVTVTVGSGAP